MSKIVLSKIRLINWYGFINRTIPVAENLTLISGENECGKSTILDAVKYAYTGDTQFNKATSGTGVGMGRRNLVSYTRCLVDASAGIYARPAEKIPVVYTHIALEYLDQVNRRAFVLGVVLETAAADIRGTYWYAAEGKRLTGLAFTYEEASVQKPYDAAGFQKANGLTLRKKQEGIALFMQMTGLKLSPPEVSKYQTKLRNIMAYNPAAKIQEFIKESVLERQDVNFDKLKEAKKNIEQINHNLEMIQGELQDLDAILKDYDEHDRRALRLKIDDIKIQYKKLLDSREKRRCAEEIIRQNQFACENLDQKLEKLEQEIRELDNAYIDAKGALKELDVSKAILAAEDQLNQYEARRKELEREKEALELFQRKLRQLLERLRLLDSPVDFPELADRITDREWNFAEKQRELEAVKEKVTDCRDMLVKQEAELEQKLKAVQQECREQSAIIENCKKNRNDYSYAAEQRSLIQEINREFAKRGVKQEARLACEYVVSLKDEAWRDAIEAFLGIHRYAVIVEPEFFDIANRVLDASGHRYVELVNTKRLMERKAACEVDSVYHFLEIRNVAAARYFTFWLGGIHAVELEKVPEYDSAMSKEGKLSRNMAVTYLNKKKIRSYCLGNEAVELNKKRAEAHLAEAEAQERELLRKQHAQREQMEFLKNSLEEFRPYNLNAHRDYAGICTKIEDEKRRYQELLTAQKNNQEFIALSERVGRLEQELNRKKDEREKETGEKGRLQVEIGIKQQDVSEERQKETAAEQHLLEERELHKSAAESAVSEYDAYCQGLNKDGGLMQAGTKERSERRVRELEANINGQQQAYNNRKQETDRLPIGLAYEAEYQRRRGKIWIDDLQGIQQKLREQTKRYEGIFKREFVLNIYETAKDARSHISEINKELRKLRFSTRYQFDVRLLDDRSDYANILRYAEYLKESNNMADGQLTLSELSGYSNEEAEEQENQIKEIINRIIDKNDAREVEKFADYRNYMSYEIIINNDEVKDGKLSRQVGYNSGAGTQIPYTLILSAALSMLYNARVNSVRILFIDEPFEKMSDRNIKLMLEFFKNQDFQVIFCAPPNKLESIGSECGVIIPVLKNSNDDMQIGQVKFHEGL